MARLIKSGIVITGDAKGGIRAMRMTQTELRALKKGMDSGGRSAKTYSKNMRGLHSSSNGLLGTIRQLSPALGGLGGALIARKIIDAGLAMDGYERALRAVLGSAEKAGQELAFVRAEADRVGVAFQPVVAEYAKLAAAARQTALEGQGVRDTFTAIIEVSRVLNLTSEDTRGAIFALQQMMSKGKVSAEELRRQLGERIPGSFAAMARAAEVTTIELDAMLKKGELISEEILPKFAAELRKMAAAGIEFASKSPAAEFARLQNAVFSFNVEASKDLLPLLAKGAKIAVPAINALAKEMDSLITIAATITFARLGGPAFVAVGASLVETTKFIKAFGIAEVAAMNRTSMLAAAARGLSGSLALIGGPAGVAIAAAGAIYLLAQRHQEAQRDAIAHRKAIGDLIFRLHDLDKAATEGLLGDTEARNLNLMKELQGVNRELANQKSDLELASRSGAEYQGMVDRAKAAIERLTVRQDELTTELGRNNRVIYKSNERLAELAYLTSAAGQAELDLKKEVDGVVEGLGRKLDGLNNTRGALLDHADALLKNKKLTEEQRTALQEKVTALRAALKAQEDSKTSLKEHNAELQKGQGLLAGYLTHLDPVAAAEATVAANLALVTLAAADAGLALEDLGDIEGYLRRQHDELLTVQERRIAYLDDLADGTDELKRELQRENEVLEIAIANNVDLAVAKAMVSGATADQIAEIRDLIAINNQLTGQYEKLTEDTDALATAITRSVERMDDAFADFWKSIIVDGKFSFSSLKDLALNTIAEIIHALTTQRFVANIAVNAGGSLSWRGGGSGGINTSGIGGGGGFGGGGGNPLGFFGNFLRGGGGAAQTGTTAPFSGAPFPSQAAGGGGGFFSNMIFGTGVSDSFAGLPGWLGGGQGGMFSTGQELGIQNWQYAVASLIGGIVGDNLFGGAGGMGGSIGASLGMAMGGVPGAVIGGFIGGLAGGVFGDERTTRLVLGGGDFSSPGQRDEMQTAFGPLVGVEGSGGVGNFGVAGDFANEAGTAIQELDALVASFLTDEEIAQATEHLKDWRVTFREADVTVENFVNDRFDSIVQAFDEDIYAFVRTFDTLEARINAFASAMAAGNILEEFPELFEGRTWQEFVLVAQSMQMEGEALVDTMGRLLNAMAMIDGATQALQAFADSDLTATYKDLLEAANTTLFEKSDNVTAALRTALRDFDNSAESVVEISGLVQRRYEMELEMLTQIDSYIAQINNSIGGTIEGIQTDLRSPTENYNFFRGQAEWLAGQLALTDDPQRIAEMTLEIDRLVNRAYGFLTEEQKQAMGAEIIAFLEEVQGFSTGALGDARADILSDAELLRGQIDTFINEIGDPLLLAATSLGLSAEDLANAAALIGGDYFYIPARAINRAGNPGGVVDPIKPGDTEGSYTIDNNPANDSRVETMVRVQVDSTSVENAVITAANTNAAAVHTVVREIRALTSALRNGYGGREVGGSVV